MKPVLTANLLPPNSAPSVAQPWCLRSPACSGVTLLLLLSLALLVGCGGETGTSGTATPQTDAAAQTDATAGGSDSAPGADASAVDVTTAADATAATDAATNPDATPSTDATTTPDGTVTVAPTWAKVHKEIIIKNSCNNSYCHGGAGGGKLKLFGDAKKDYDAFMLGKLGGTQKDACSAGSYVVPGKPDESLLWLKTNKAANHGCGNKMPPSGDQGLSATESQLIRDWILAGAKF